MHRILGAGAVAVALALALASASGAQQQIDPNNFVRGVDNPWFPLKPGSVWRYRGVKDGKPSRDIVKVTNATKAILGVTTTAVSDRLYLSGKLEELTTDWYAQDRQGNVWYFGEDTKELDSHGHVKSTEGSWQAGVNGAKAGIYMPARPRIGERHREEFYKGHAEDWSQVVARNVSVSVPWGSSRRALKTKEWTPLEPGVIDNKFYVRGVGTVLERTAKGPTERNSLLSFKRG